MTVESLCVDSGKCGDFQVFDCAPGASKWCIAFLSVSVCEERSCRRIGPELAAEKFEAPVLFDPCKPARSDRTVALFAKNDFANTFGRKALFIYMNTVVLRAIQEHNYVGVLFERSGLSEV